MPVRAAGGRRWVFRSAAMVCSAGLLVLLELVCGLLGWGTDVTLRDAWASFDSGRPLFVPDGATGRVTTAPNRRRFFQQETFARRKAPGTFRVFCLGGSTVQGNPFGKQTAFSAWLQRGLEAVDPSRRWEVINCGGLSYASYRVAAVLDECLTYEPDLFVLCTGHNEFLEDRSFGNIKRAPRWLAATVQTASRLRTFNLARQAWERFGSVPRARTRSAPGGAKLADEVDAMLDYEGGLKLYRRDAAWREGVIQDFEANVRHMVAASRRAGVPIILVKPVSNLRDCPPFKSQHRDDLTPDELERWAAAMRRAAPAPAGDPRASMLDLEEAVAIDPRYAATWFELGRACEAAGEVLRARAAYFEAREQDICPLRILAPMEAALTRIAAEEGVTCLDWPGLLAAQAPCGIPGNDSLLDHVHPSIPGHQQLAGSLMTTMAAHGWLDLPSEWLARRNRAWNHHLASLPADYYDAGLHALEGLHAWTQGRADGPAVEYWALGRRPAQRIVRLPIGAFRPTGRPIQSLHATPPH
ncbi:MAG: SGNH/GDSL hydrolase family protein [Verrucomicrobiales bacterium]|nr:SGNH/GDSL hydrolase family protein [Verrucomicrobiales bacterium]MCP5525194.1 SGNH/GDSL hydrolase family protein [Verrucomicrobiales bacterium]